MSEIEVTLPSGLSGMVCNWKTKNLRALANRSLIRKPGLALEAHLMRLAWVKTLDPGPYAFDGKPRWEHEVLQGDTYDGLRQVRIMTWGSDMEVDFRCREDLCKTPIPLLVPLDEMPVRCFEDDGMEEAAAAFADGNVVNWHWKLAGKDVKYQLPTGATAVKAAKLAKKHGPCMENNLAARLVEVQGVEANHLVKYLGDLDPPVTRDLRDELDRINPGIDTAIDCECPDFECATEQEHELPFSVDFYLPEKRKKTIGATRERVVFT